MKTKDYYMKLNYPVILENFYDEGERLFSAEIRELPGLIVYGDSSEEVIEEIELAKEDWIDANIELGREIQEPLPKYDENCSGRITLRLPKGLHGRIKAKSVIDGVSLNQEVVQLINDGLYSTLYRNQLDTIKSKFVFEKSFFVQSDKHKETKLFVLKENSSENTNNHLVSRKKVINMSGNRHSTNVSSSREEYMEN
jgi:predicted HicB family RNase H-like nuclease